jgi:hypothetical protein
VRISVIIEGTTEKAFIPHLRRYLQTRLSGRMPDIDALTYDGRIPTRDKLQRLVFKLLRTRPNADHVIALTDVYTGTNPPDFLDATDAKSKMQQWVGDEPRFHPHAAQYDFEAWLLPYWSDIQRLAGHNRTPPGGSPETVNHSNPPAHRIKEIFRIGNCRDDYVKPRDASRILQGNDLSVAVLQCSELKAFVNTILSVCGGEVVP